MNAINRLEQMDNWMRALKRMMENHMCDVRAEGVKEEKIGKESFFRAVSELSKFDAAFRTWATAKNIKILYWKMV